jgi:hypothetical protein
MSEERFLPDHLQFFAELMADSDSDSDFEGFDEPDQPQQQVNSRLFTNILPTLPHPHNKGMQQ